METVEKIDELIEKYKQEWVNYDALCKKAKTEGKIKDKHLTAGLRDKCAHIINDLVFLRSELMK